MAKLIGLIMFLIPYLLLTKNTIQTTAKEYMWRDLKTAWVVLTIVSIYWGLAGYLLGK